MKKSTIIGIAIVAVLAIWGISTYNGLVETDETVSKAWGDVQTTYQRRADLIPNLVATVKGYAEHEQSTFEAVTAARSQATGIHLSVEDLNEENMKKFQEAQSQLNSALGRLIAIQENYPELKANEQFSELQAQLEGTENRINEARRTFNAAVKDYNVKVRRFPGSVIAGFTGFERKAEFAAEAGAEKAPTVQF